VLAILADNQNPDIKKDRLTADLRLSKKSLSKIRGQDGLLPAQPTPCGFAQFRVCEEQAKPVNWRKTVGFRQAQTGSLPIYIQLCFNSIGQ
jgi:hypothetical protein